MMKFHKKLALSVTAAFCLTLFAAQTALAAGRELVPMGTTVGIELKTPGVIVVGLEASGGGTRATESPAAKAGILPGDMIVRLGGDNVTSAETFLSLVSELDGGDTAVTVVRDGKTMQFTVKPLVTEDTVRLGLWVRDSITGVGTMTFYDPDSGAYGALGHSVNDSESNAILPLGSGSITDATVVDVHIGETGKPGELCGVFDLNSRTGSILSNTNAGIFGITARSGNAPPLRDAIPTASEDEVHTGAATILSNVSGRDVGEYSVEITRIYRGETSGRSLMLKITDPALLEKTGGIVQGMSGSPIIQDGKLVGAVTHVLVSDPTKGYGILIDDMLAECDLAVAEEDAA